MTSWDAASEVKARATDSVDAILVGNCEVSPLDAQKMIAEADEDGSGSVTFMEFVQKIMKNQ